MKLGTDREIEDMCYEVRKEGGDAAAALKRAREMYGWSKREQLFYTGPWRRGKRRYEKEAGLLQPVARRKKPAPEKDSGDAPVAVRVADGEDVIMYQSSRGKFSMVPKGAGEFEVSLNVRVRRDVSLSLQGQAFSLLFPDD